MSYISLAGGFFSCGFVGWVCICSLRKLELVKKSGGNGGMGLMGV